MTKRKSTKTLWAGVAALMAASLLAGAAQASPPPAPKAEGGGSRTIEVRYDGGAIPFLYCLHCPYLESRPGERYVSVEVIDDLSPKGYADFVWNSKSDPTGHNYFEVCGKTRVPQPIPAEAEITLYPWMVPGATCTQGFSTSGIIKLTFTRHP